MKLSHSISKHIHYSKFPNGPEKYFALLSDIPFHFSGLSHFSPDADIISAAWCCHNTPVANCSDMSDLGANLKFSAVCGVTSATKHSTRVAAWKVYQPTAPESGGSGLVSAISTSDVGTVLPDT